MSRKFSQQYALRAALFKCLKHKYGVSFYLNLDRKCSAPFGPNKDKKIPHSR